MHHKDEVLGVCSEEEEAESELAQAMTKLVESHIRRVSRGGTFSIFLRRGKDAEEGTPASTMECSIVVSNPAEDRHECTYRVHRVEVDK
jgi:hypothetical protein